LIHCENVADVYTKSKMSIWLLSAFKAGFINSAGFLITGKFVSHVTGFGTQVGIATGHADYFFGAELLIIPLSFIFGGVVTSFILEGGNSSRAVPRYHYVQGLITFLIFVVILFGDSGIISSNVPFDIDQKYDLAEFSIMGLLCLICGLKNSLVTWTTYGKIRVTHLTGISTDIGLHLISTITNRNHGTRLKEKRIINLHRIATLFSFSIGAFISAVLFPRIGYKAFYIVFAISFYMTILSFYKRPRANVTLGT
jgi:uncharacterized membrane protein YoaK (UPF0700 family)